MKGKYWACIGLLTASLVLLVSTADAFEMNQRQRQQLMPGRLYMVPLSEFAPGTLRAPCDALLSGDYNNATVGFQQELAKRPSDFAAFVGLMQAEPALWPATIQRLKEAVKYKQDDPVMQFQLGATLYYDGKMKYLYVSQQQGQKELSEAKKYLTQAWQSIKEPVVGLLYAETEQIPSPHFMLTPKVLDQLIDHLAGQKAYASFQHAAQNGWQGEPPSLRTVPAAHLMPLRGVVRLYRSLSDVRVGHGQMQDGHMGFVYEPVSPERQQQVNYFANWQSNITNALKQQ